MTAPDTGLLGSLAPALRWTPLRSRDSWRTSLLVLVLLLISIIGFHAILIGSAWFAPLALICILMLGAAAVTRLISRRLWLPPVVSILALFAALTAFFAPQTGFLVVVPTGDTFAAFGRLFDAAGASINRQSLPAEADTGILFLMCVGVGAIAIAADLLTITLGAPALVALPLVVLLEVPASVRPGSTDPFVFIGVALVYLLLLRVGSRRGQGLLSLGLAAVVMVFALVIPIALPSVDGSQAQPVGAGTGTGVNPVLALGDSLRQSSKRTVLTYSTASGNAQYLRLVSIDHLLGSNWGPDAFSLDRGNGVDKFPKPPGLTSPIKRTSDTTTIEISGLASAWLPLPYPVSSVSGLGGSWYFDSAGLAVASPDRDTTNQSYVAKDVVVTPTVSQLRAAGDATPSGMPEFLQVPRDLPAIIGDTAQKVAGAKATEYDKALALQSYFHDGDFVYSETAPVDAGYDGTGEQVIAKFLQAKSGYCIHFASAMAMMARVLGIPSRVSVGFLPGTRVERVAGKASYAVSMRDLHAWPELYFTGVGWVRFEPTVSRGIVPGYATVAEAEAAATAAPTDTAAPSSSANATRAPLETSAPSSSGSASASSSSASNGPGLVGWLALVVALIVLLGLVPALIRMIQRGRRMRLLATARAPALLAWTELVQTSDDLGDRLPDTLTPRESAARLAGASLVESEQVQRLLDALEKERFARDPRAYSGAAADLRSALGDLRAKHSTRARVRAALLPPSIWRRISPGA